MYIYLNIYDMITTITNSNTPAPTAPITTSMLLPVFFDSDSTKIKLFDIEENEKSVKAKERKPHLVFQDLILNNHASFYW